MTPLEYLLLSTGLPAAVQSVINLMVIVFHWALLLMLVNDCPRPGRGQQEQDQDVEQQDQDVEQQDQDMYQQDQDMEDQQRLDGEEDGIHCPVQNCGVQLANRCNLNRHLQEVHQQVKYHCPEPGCMARYSRPGNLRRHRQQHGH